MRQGTNALAIMQSEVMREADDYATAVTQAADDFSAKVATPEARVAGLHWKLQQATAAYINATGENPALNAVDMVVLASLSTTVVENYWVGQQFGASAQPLLETHRKLQKQAWSVVSEVLTPAQQQELNELIADWCRKNPNLRYVAAVRFREFLGVLGKEAGQEPATKPNSVLNLLDLDPLAGLDPAVRAIEQTRYLAERIVYYIERAPSLLSWQVELLTYQLAEQPAARQLLADANRLSQSAEVFARTTEQFPKLVNDQREAAIAQLLAGVALERSNILASLEAQESRLRALLPEMRQTLAAGGDMATSLDGAIKSLDAFVHYVSPPDTNPPVVSTNSKPFDVLDYGKAAAQAGAMARDLNTLLTSVDQTVPRIEALSQQAAAKAQHVVDRAFWLGLLLIAVFLAGSVLAALTYRALANRMGRESRKLPLPGQPV